MLAVSINFLLDLGATVTTDGPGSFYFEVRCLPL